MGKYTILVPYNGTPSGDDVLHLAFDAARSHDGRVVVLALTEVHPAIRLVDLPSIFDEEGWGALERANTVARERGLVIECRLCRTHDAGKAIVSEARRIQADAIFLALKTPRFSWLPPRLGARARTVMRLAPCPVVLGSTRRTGQLRESEAVGEAERVLKLVR